MDFLRTPGDRTKTGTARGWYTGGRDDPECINTPPNQLNLHGGIWGSRSCGVRSSNQWGAGKIYWTPACYLPAIGPDKQSSESSPDEHPDRRDCKQMQDIREQKLMVTYSKYSGSTRLRLST